jgi:hypothetical protein
MGTDHGRVSPQLLGEMRARSFNSMEDGVSTLQVRGVSPVSPPISRRLAGCVHVLSASYAASVHLTMDLRIAYRFHGCSPPARKALECASVRWREL